MRFQSSGDFIKRIDLTMGFLDLVISHERAALFGLGQVRTAEFKRFWFGVAIGTRVQPERVDFTFKTRQVSQRTPEQLSDQNALRRPVSIGRWLLRASFHAGTDGLHGPSQTINYRDDASCDRISSPFN